MIYNSKSYTNDFFRAFLSLEFGGVAIKVPVFINFFGINQPLSQKPQQSTPQTLYVLYSSFMELSEKYRFCYVDMCGFLDTD